MPALQPSDLTMFTQGRLAADDPLTAFHLDAALTRVRNRCRWNVNPVVVDDVAVFDGPGTWGGLSVGIGGLYYASGSYLTGVLRRSRFGADSLMLPTKRLLGISSIIENGDVLQPGVDFTWSAAGVVVKTPYTPWTSNFQSIQVTYTHGYEDEEAGDWRRIVLAVADRTSMVRGLIGPFSTSMGPYRVNAYYGESRTGTLPLQASWDDDLMGQIDVVRYQRIDNV